MLSSLDVMNACTSFSVPARDRQSLILLIFLRWKKQVLQVLVTCLSSDTCLSKITPMFLAEGDGLICSSEVGVDGVVHSRSEAPSFLCLVLAYCTPSMSRSQKHMLLF